jgi:hypothetical protein
MPRVASHQHAVTGGREAGIAAIDGPDRVTSAVPSGILESSRTDIGRMTCDPGFLSEFAPSALPH